jgi:hypothetical protein
MVSIAKRQFSQNYSVSKSMLAFIPQLFIHAPTSCGRDSCAERPPGITSQFMAKFYAISRMRLWRKPLPVKALPLAPRQSVHVEAS